MAMALWLWRRLAMAAPGYGYGIVAVAVPGYGGAWLWHCGYGGPWLWLWHCGCGGPWLWLWQPLAMAGHNCFGPSLLCRTFLKSWKAPVALPILCLLFFLQSLSHSTRLPRCTDFSTLFHISTFNSTCFCIFVLPNINVLVFVMLTFNLALHLSLCRLFTSCRRLSPFCSIKSVSWE